MNQNKRLAALTNKDDHIKKRFDDFNKGIESFRKIQSGEMKLKEVKTLNNVFKSNLNEISKGRNKTEEQKNGIRKY